MNLEGPFVSRYQRVRGRGPCGYLFVCELSFPLMTVTPAYLGVYKASYDYTAQGDDEISVEEDQLLFLLDGSDDELAGNLVQRMGAHV